MRQHQRGARAVSRSLARAALAAAAGIGSLTVVVAVAPGEAHAAGIVPPANPAVNIPPQVVPQCTTTPVDDTSAGCIDSVLHNINYARSLESLGPMVLPTTYAGDPVAVQQLIIADEERDDRGLQPFTGLDPALDAAALTGAQNDEDPSPPAGYQYSGGGANFAQDSTPLGADYAWMYDDGYGGTNLSCTSASDTSCWGHRENILGPWTTTGSQTAQMGDADTGTGQYTQIFMNQGDPADSLIDPLTPSTLPTPSAARPPDVVQVIPASSASTEAGTPVTIEGNYFDSSSAPQVFFGGVAATNVQVNWNGELSADAPADPAGSATDQVVVTVSTSAGSSSPSGVAQVNQFTYAPSTAPTVTAVSPTSGPLIPTHSVTISGANLTSGGVQPIVDFGTVASIGAMTYGATQITATIPSAINPGTVNITVTTTAGTSRVSADDQYTYTGSGTTTSPAVTSGNHATFTAGAAGVFDITTTGTPAVSSVSDSAFGGCIPSTLPASITLDYTGGTTATLDGTPQAGDGGSFTVCVTAANGVGPVATQVFTLRVDAAGRPVSRTVSSVTGHPAGTAARVLAGGLGRRHLHLRRSPVLRFDRLVAPAATGGRDHADGEPRWVLAGRLGRGRLRFRQRRLLRIHSGEWTQPRRLGTAAQLECAHRRHGALQRRRWLLHGGLGRGRLRLR